MNDAPPFTPDPPIAGAGPRGGAVDPPSVQAAKVARLRIVHETAERQVRAANARIAAAWGEHWEARLAQRLKRLVDSTEAPWTRLDALHQLADAFMAFMSPSAACAAGCTHCCHIPLRLYPVEAARLGARIGRRPRTLQLPGPRYPASYDHPCPFLKQGRCSIYAQRPLLCRVHINLDRDALLCELSQPANRGVIGLQIAEWFKAADLGICQARTDADIRDWFPAETTTP